MKCKRFHLWVINHWPVLNFPSLNITHLLLQMFTWWIFVCTFENLAAVFCVWKWIWQQNLPSCAYVAHHSSSHIFLYLLYTQVYKVSLLKHPLKLMQIKPANYRTNKLDKNRMKLKVGLPWKCQEIWGPNCMWMDLVKLFTFLLKIIINVTCCTLVTGSAETMWHFTALSLHIRDSKKIIHIMAYLQATSAIQCSPTNHIRLDFRQLFPLPCLCSYTKHNMKNQGM